MSKKTSRRDGKPYIWVTWLSKLLGGDQCVWAVWFKARHWYQKHGHNANMDEWQRDHTALVQAQKAKYLADGYDVREEDVNAFKLEGKSAIISGKPDLIAVKATYPDPDNPNDRIQQVLVWDGKTGEARQSDWWQVLIYLYAVPRAFKELAGHMTAILGYSKHPTNFVPSAELTQERMDAITSLILTIASDTPPPQVPSARECRFCNIGPADCPARYKSNESATVAVEDF